MLTIPQPDLKTLISGMRAGTRFIAVYPCGQPSLFTVFRKRGTSFECEIINGAHKATFDAQGECKRHEMKIVYVRPDDVDCPYTVRDYNTGLALFVTAYKESKHVGKD